MIMEQICVVLYFNFVKGFVKIMRIITGTVKGRRLEAPRGSDTVRPTTDKVKEAIFSMIQFDIEGKCVLDLFAGSGQLGLEALSRGAESAVFIDAAHSSFQLTKRNVAVCGFEDKAKVYNADFKAFLNGTQDKFDIAFLDPPYAAGLLNDAILSVSEKMNPDGIIVCEHGADFDIPELVGFLRKDRIYGKTTVVTVFRKEGIV